MSSLIGLAIVGLIVAGGITWIANFGRDSREQFKEGMRRQGMDPERDLREQIEEKLEQAQREGEETFEQAQREGEDAYRQWKALPTLKSYLAKSPECQTDRGIKCANCNASSIRCVGLQGPAAPEQVFICNHCGTRLYRSAD